MPEIEEKELRELANIAYHSIRAAKSYGQPMNWNNSHLQRAEDALEKIVNRKSPSNHPLTGVKWPMNPYDKSMNTGNWVGFATCLDACKKAVGDASGGIKSNDYYQGWDDAIKEHCSPKPVKVSVDSILNIIHPMINGYSATYKKEVAQAIVDFIYGKAT